MNSLWITLIALLIQTGVAVPAQPALAGSSSVEGMVVRLGTSEPIAGVDLELAKLDDPQLVTAGSAPTPTPTAPRPPYTAKTGNDGKFIFRNLPAGSFKLVAARIGGLFTPVEYGQRGVLGRGVPFPLGDGQQMKDIKLEMAPVGSISGRVFDENSKGIGHAAVLALTPIYREGQQFLTIMQIVHTDDRGEYRLFSLVPGRYYVTARPEEPTRRTVPLHVVPPGRISSYEQSVSPVVTKRILATGEVLEETFGFVYYGGATDPRMATPITLAPGGNLGAVDIPLSAGKVKARHVRGKVINGVTGGPAAGANVRLIPRTFSAHLIVPLSITDAAGVFDIAGVVPGNYSLYVLGANVQQRAPTPGVPPPPSIPLMTMLPLDIGNDDVNNLTLSIVQGSTVTGSVLIEGRAANDPDLTRIRVDLESVPTGVAMVQPVGAPATAGGALSIANVWPANYRVRVNGIPANMYVKSIRLGALDLLNTTVRIPLQSEAALEVVVAVDTGSMEGRVLNERSLPSSNVKVAVVPDSPLRSRVDLYKSSATDLSGTFRIAGIPPGDYKVFAWEDVEDGAWMDPEFLRFDETRGTSVRIGSNRKESVTATVIPGKR